MTAAPRLLLPASGEKSSRPSGRPDEGPWNPDAAHLARGALSAILRALLASADPAILVEIVRAEGSTPREAGAAMLVTTGASQGTIGGGALEFHAVDVARVMIARGETARRLDMPLGPVLGQCCGGRVVLDLRRAGPGDLARLEAAEADRAARRSVVLVFGCGHTGLALTRALAPLPLRTILVDDRLDPVAPPPGIGLLRLDDPVEAAASAEPGAAFAIMTHSHALDYRLAEAALGRGDAAYVGLIGSATKRALFSRSYLRGGGAEADLAGLACPLGGGAVRDKRPEVIAALAAAEILTAFARHASCGAAMIAMTPSARSRESP